MKPGGRGIDAPADSKGEEFFKRAVEAEGQQKWEEALGSYSLALDTDAKFAPAYERLSALQTRRGLLKDAVATLVKMVAQVPSAHSYSLLALSSAKYSIREKQLAAAEPQEEKKGGLLGRKKKAPAPVVSTSGFAMPVNALDAAALSLRAAQQAVKLAPVAAESQLALGFALLLPIMGRVAMKTPR
jgi:tetratricopeptide (TPR) repeat protein